MDAFNKKVSYSIVLRVIAIILFVETSIMFFLYYLIPQRYILIAIFLDPLLLSIISAPLIYLLIIKPYVTKNAMLCISVVRNAIAIVESREPFTSGHMRRVANLSRLIAKKLNLSVKSIDDIYYAALVHDLGKIHIPVEVLIYPGKLEPEAFALIKTHSIAGFDILNKNELPWPLAEVAIQHHERLDGSGYPYGLKGDAILLEAQIVAVADVYDAVISERPYRFARNSEAALEILIAEAGIRLNEKAVKACIELVRTGEYKGKRSSK